MPDWRDLFQLWRMLEDMRRVQDAQVAQAYWDGWRTMVMAETPAAVDASAAGLSALVQAASIDSPIRRFHEGFISNGGLAELRMSAARKERLAELQEQAARLEVERAMAASRGDAEKQRELEALRWVDTKLVDARVQAFLRALGRGSLEGAEEALSVVTESAPDELKPYIPSAFWNRLFATSRMLMEAYVTTLQQENLRTEIQMRKFLLQEKVDEKARMGELGRIVSQAFAQANRVGEMPEAFLDRVWAPLERASQSPDALAKLPKVIPQLLGDFVVSYVGRGPGGMLLDREGVREQVIRGLVMGFLEAGMKGTGLTFPPSGRRSETQREAESLALARVAREVGPILVEEMERVGLIKGGVDPEALFTQALRSRTELQPAGQVVHGAVLSYGVALEDKDRMRNMVRWVVERAARWSKTLGEMSALALSSGTSGDATSILDVLRLRNLVLEASGIWSVVSVEDVLDRLRQGAAQRVGEGMGMSKGTKKPSAPYSEPMGPTGPYRPW